MNFQITVLEKLRSLSLSDYDGYIVSIKGEELCSNSFCVLGIHTKCIEDLNDFKPQCVSPCKTGRIYLDYPDTLLETIRTVFSVNRKQKKSKDSVNRINKSIERWDKIFWKFGDISVDKKDFCSNSARCLHQSENVPARCLCLGADSSITFGSQCQYSLPLIAILFISSLCIFIIVIIAAFIIKVRIGIFYRGD